MCLAKILDSEFNVFQFIDNDEAYRIYETKNGIVLGIKVMKTKVIHPLKEDKKYKELYDKYRNTSFIN